MLFIEKHYYLETKKHCLEGNACLSFLSTISARVSRFSASPYAVFCIDATRTSTLYKSFVNGSLAYLQPALQ